MYYDKANGETSDGLHRVQINSLSFCSLVSGHRIRTSIHLNKSEYKK